MTAAAIQKMSTKELQAECARLSGSATSSRNKKALTARLLKLVAEQRPSRGAEKPKTKPGSQAMRVRKAEQSARRPRSKAAEQVPNTETPKSRRSRADLPPVGTVLTHDFSKAAATAPARAIVEADGVRYGDTIYPSLGAAALAASGLAWNGRFFWKVDGKPIVPYPKHAKRG